MGLHKMNKDRGKRYLEAQRIIVWLWVIFLVLFFLFGCSSEKRQFANDSDECYEQGKRAVMLCDGLGSCFIECREKRDD